MQDPMRPALMMATARTTVAKTAALEMLRFEAALTAAFGEPGSRADPVGLDWTLEYVVIGSSPPAMGRDAVAVISAIEAR